MSASTTTQEAPALTLARLAWRYGLTPERAVDLGAGDADALAREAGVEPGPRVWVEAIERLAGMWKGAADPRWSHLAPQQDLAGVVTAWNRNPWGDSTALAGAPQQAAQPARAESVAERAARLLTEHAEPEPEPEPAPEPEPVVWPDPVIPDDAPTGWAALAALGPIPGTRCHHCPRPAVTRTLDVWRCAEHPPTTGEWGARLDYTPHPERTCAPGRCYCGRHTQQEVAQ